MSRTAVPTLKPMPVPGWRKATTASMVRITLKTKPEVEEVAVDVLQEQGEAGLAGVGAVGVGDARRPAARARTTGSRPCGSSSR